MEGESGAVRQACEGGVGVEQETDLDALLNQYQAFQPFPARLVQVYGALGSFVGPPPDTLNKIHSALDV